TSSIDNPRILRYADVLLLKAEAILKSGGNKEDAIDLINQIRERARNSASPASAVPADRSVSETDESTIMQWIMDERLLELCAEEGIRWFDLKRWHAAGYINLANWTASDNDFSSVRIDFKFSDWYNQTAGKMLFPIPTAEVNANPSIKQNTGY
ncbi:MAG: RagB/SusD family nutrient uptake outer membrane protein, partial [Bacteroidales bacterium]